MGTPLSFGLLLTGTMLGDIQSLDALLAQYEPYYLHNMCEAFSVWLVRPKDPAVALHIVCKL